MPLVSTTSKKQLETRSPLRLMVADIFLLYATVPLNVCSMLSSANDV